MKSERTKLNRRRPPAEGAPRRPSPSGTSRRPGARAPVLAVSVCSRGTAGARAGVRTPHAHPTPLRGRRNVRTQTYLHALAEVRIREAPESGGRPMPAPQPHDLLHLCGARAVQRHLQHLIDSRNVIRPEELAEEHGRAERRGQYTRVHFVEWIESARARRRRPARSRCGSLTNARRLGGGGIRAAARPQRGGRGRRAHLDIILVDVMSQSGLLRVVAAQAVHDGLVRQPNLQEHQPRLVAPRVFVGMVPQRETAVRALRVSQHRCGIAAAARPAIRDVEDRRRGRHVHPRKKQQQQPRESNPPPEYYNKPRRSAASAAAFASGG